MQKEMTMCHLRTVQVFTRDGEDNHKNLSYENVRLPLRHLSSTGHSCSQLRQIARAKKRGRIMNC